MSNYTFSPEVCWNTLYAEGEPEITTPVTTEFSTEPVTTETTSGTVSTVTTGTSTVPVTTTVTNPEDIFEFREINGKLVIINCDIIVVNVVVPETIDGKTVSKVNDFAFSNEEIESVTFENPDIEIADSPTTINEDAVIYGYWDSTAHDYAEKYNREFVSLDGEPDYLPGDISGNDKIDLYDAIEICKSIMGMRTFTDAEKKIADYNGDGKVDLYDAIGIAKKLLEK